MGPYYKCGCGVTKPFTIKQKVSYSYSSGNNGVNSVSFENKWEKVKSSNLSSVQYAEIYDADTGEMLSRNPSGAVDISSIKNIMLRLQAQAAQGQQASMEWTLY